VSYRIGLGDDVHRLGADSPLYLGGVIIEGAKGAIAHSDGDVVFHALIDALLGALALGDVGDHFPPTDDRYKDISSQILLTHVYNMMRECNYLVVNVDVIIHLESPKLGDYKRQIKQSLAASLRVDDDCVNVKAKTAEQLDGVGAGLAVNALVTVLLQKNH
jgi:2-C-methyl-D-erythritol 2,4-cyclodiphosphate synthase